MGNSSLLAILYQLKSPVISAAKGRMGSDLPESVCETSEVYLQLALQTVNWTEGYSRSRKMVVLYFYFLEERRGLIQLITRIECL